MKVVGVFDTWRDEVVLKLDESRGVSHLQRWLEGKGLPHIDNYTEGHTWLLETIKDVPNLQGKLAMLTGELIENYLNRRVVSGDLPRLLFNLLYFCAGIRQPVAASSADIAPPSDTKPRRQFRRIRGSTSDR
jgi:hypothetical protein